MRTVSLIILNWNGWENINKCLNSVNKLIINTYDLQTIVVDNGSTDNSVKKIKNFFPKITLLKNKQNLGYASGNNIGIRYALNKNSDFLFILNNDTLLHPKIIEEILATHQRTSASIISPKIYFTAGCEFHKLRYKPSDWGRVIWYAGGIIDWRNIVGFHFGVDEVDNGQFNQDKEVDFATGAALFVRRNIFEKIGLFDEKFYLYYEDLDFCQKAKKAHEKIMFSANAIMWHNNAGSNRSGSDLQDYYITRNRLLFGMKYAPFRNKISLLKEAILLSIVGRKWQKRGVIDFFLRNFGKGSYV